jgi:hypothetical protein
MKKEFGEKYASITDVSFTAKYRASCFCNAVEYEVGSATITFFLAFGFPARTYCSVRAGCLLLLWFPYIVFFLAIL